MIFLSWLKQHRFVFAVLGIACALRVAVVLTVYADTQVHASDAFYYIVVAKQPLRLVTSGDAAVKSIGPLYPLFLVPFFHLIPDTAPNTQLIAVRIVHVLLDTMTVGFIYLLARHLFGERVGRVALIAQAMDPRYIYQMGIVATETLFVVLFTAFMLLYVTAAAQPDLRRLRWAGVLLGLATLTRPVTLLFPAALGVLAWLRPKDNSRRGVAWVTGIMLLLVVPWIVRTVAVTGEPIPIAETAFSHLWLSSRADGRNLGGQSLEQAAVQDSEGAEAAPSVSALSPQDYASTGVRNIRAAPVRWLARIASDTARAYLQPYGTHLLVAPSSRGIGDALQDGLAGRTSLIDVTSIPGFWRRLLMYVWHFWGLLAGAAGAILAWRRGYLGMAPLVAWIVYGTLVAAPLLVEPRYLFPLMFAFTVLAAYATTEVWDALQRRLGAGTTRNAEGHA